MQIYWERSRMDVTDRRKRAGGEAADWFARLQAGSMDRTEREQFVEWLRESHVHVAEMLRIAQIHGSLERFQQWARIPAGPKEDEDNIIPLLSREEGGAEPPQKTRRPTSGAQRVRQSLEFSAVVAGVLLVMAALVLLSGMRGQLIETERGERREVVLADGSVLHVDPATRLRVKYSDEARRVSLEKGRALFHVAKHPTRPFLVEADETTVRAVGTTFSVEQRTEGVIVTVAEGKVVVESSGSASREPVSSASPSSQPASSTNALVLTANQQATVPEGNRPEPVREVDSERALAWASGRLIFQNDELGHAVAEFNRYNRVQLTVTDAELAAKPVSGVFNAAEPEAFLAFLQSVAPVEIVRDGDRAIAIVPIPRH